MTAEADLAGGVDAIVDYERWLETARRRAARGDRALQRGGLPLDAAAPRLARRSARRRPRSSTASRSPGASRPSGACRPRRRPRAERASCRASACSRPATRPELLAHLLEYHRREARPAWWAFFARSSGRPSSCSRTPRRSACSSRTGPPRPVGGRSKSVDHGFTFPAQQHKLEAGDGVYDPATGEGRRTIVALDDAAGTLTLRRGPSLADVPLPEALVPGGPFDTRVQQAALVRLANDVGRYPHLERLLRREPPLGGARDAARDARRDEAARRRGRGQLPLRAGARPGRARRGRARG